MKKPVAVRNFSFLILAAVLLAACSSEAPATATELPAAKETPAAPTGPAPTTVPESSGASGSGELMFSIVPAESEARFIIDEVLAGSPKTVVGATRDVQGQIRIDPAHPTEASIGPIMIGADSLATDNNFRNRAIANFILQTGDYPTITFTPESIVGLPSAVSVGDAISFQVAGQLAIRDIIRPVTFDVSVNIESGTRISGRAQATVQRADFDLQIPSVPQVAGVSEQVQLELDFVAAAGG
ncbi:MAG: YceI family protein [Anaerolineales bacterium]